MAMGSGGERTHTASDGILSPKLLLSAALAAVLIVAPAGDRTSALAMRLGAGFGAGRLGGAGTVLLNNGPGVVPRSTVGSVGGGREVGIVGREHGRDEPGNPCKPGRSRLERCVVNTGHDHPGGNYPGGVDGPRGPILMTQPAGSGIGSPPPGTLGP